MKIAELSGALLDYWVARAQGWKKWDAYPDCWLTGDEKCPSFQHFHPSTDWAQGGPIIERECIHLEKFPGGDEYPEWLAFGQPDGWGEPAQDSPQRQDGPTALIAAMRAYVASRLGEEVPDMESGRRD